MAVGCTLLLVSGGSLLSPQEWVAGKRCCLPATLVCSSLSCAAILPCSSGGGLLGKAAGVTSGFSVLLLCRSNLACRQADKQWGLSSSVRPQTAD